jgi:hypothetical protein
MIVKRRRVFYFKFGYWTWWVWCVTDGLLLAGLFASAQFFLAAIALTIVQTVILLVRDRSLRAFAVQLRIAFLFLLLISYFPEMRWLYWLPAIGLLALVIFGYCLLARVLSLLPWNSSEPYTMDRFRRTFFSAPDMDRVESDSKASGCAGGLCTIAAQVAPVSAEK